MVLKFRVKILFSIIYAKNISVCVAGHRVIVSSRYELDVQTGGGKGKMSIKEGAKEHSGLLALVLASCRKKNMNMIPRESIVRH